MLQLHAISLGHETAGSFVKKAIEVYDFVDFIHIRERDWTVQDYVSVIEELREYDPKLKKLIINDRLDIAVMQNLSRLHLPSHSHQLEEVKERFPQLKIGRSVHSLQEAKEQAKLQVDYLFFGHVFQTESKLGLEERGLAQLSEIISNIPKPIIAIGGITPEHIAAIIETGAAGVAVMSGIFAADNCREAALQYRKILDDRKGDKVGSHY